MKEKLWKSGEPRCQFNRKLLLPLKPKEQQEEMVLPGPKSWEDDGD